MEESADASRYKKVLIKSSEPIVQSDGECISKYFENNLCSDGGLIVNLTFTSSWQCVIKFKEVEDAENVVKKSCHKVNIRGKEFTLTATWDRKQEHDDGARGEALIEEPCIEQYPAAAATADDDIPQKDVKNQSSIGIRPTTRSEQLNLKNFVDVRSRVSERSEDNDDNDGVRIGIVGLNLDQEAAGVATSRVEDSSRCCLNSETNSNMSNTITQYEPFISVARDTSSVMPEGDKVVNLESNRSSWPSFSQHDSNYDSASYDLRSNTLDHIQSPSSLMIKLQSNVSSDLTQEMRNVGGSAEEMLMGYQESENTLEQGKMESGLESNASREQTFQEAPNLQDFHLGSNDIASCGVKVSGVGLHMDSDMKILLRSKFRKFGKSKEPIIRTSADGSHALVVFDQPEDIKEAMKQHKKLAFRISHTSLRLEVLNPQPLRPTPAGELYPNMLLCSALCESITECDIRAYMEDRLNYKVKTLLRNRDRALVELHENIDEAKVLRAAGLYPLGFVMIRLERVVVSRKLILYKCNNWSDEDWKDFITDTIESEVKVTEVRGANYFIIECFDSNAFKELLDNGIKDDNVDLKFHLYHECLGSIPSHFDDSHAVDNINEEGLLDSKDPAGSPLGLGGVATNFGSAKIGSNCVTFPASRKVISPITGHSLELQSYTGGDSIGTDDVVADRNMEEMKGSGSTATFLGYNNNKGLLEHSETNDLSYRSNNLSASTPVKSEQIYRIKNLGSVIQPDEEGNINEETSLKSSEAGNWSHQCDETMARFQNLTIDERTQHKATNLSPVYQFKQDEASINVESSLESSKRVYLTPKSDYLMGRAEIIDERAQYKATNISPVNQFKQLEASINVEDSLESLEPADCGYQSHELIARAEIKDERNQHKAKNLGPVYQLNQSRNLINEQISLESFEPDDWSNRSDELMTKAERKDERPQRKVESLGPGYQPNQSSRLITEDGSLELPEPGYVSKKSDLLATPSGKSELNKHDNRSRRPAHQLEQNDSIKNDVKKKSTHVGSEISRFDARKRHTLRQSLPPEPESEELENTSPIATRKAKRLDISSSSSNVVATTTSKISAGNPTGNNCTKAIQLPAGVYWIVSTRMKSNLREVLDCFPRNVVKIKNDPTACCFTVSGPAHNVCDFEKQIQDLEDKVIIIEDELGRFGMSQHFITLSGKNKLENVSLKYGVYIENITEGLKDIKQEIVEDETEASDEEGLFHYDKCLRNRATLKLFIGNLEKFKADILVNIATEKQFKDIGKVDGVAKGVFTAGGPALQGECKKYIARNGAPLEGGYFDTPPGNLKCRQVLHVVPPTYVSNGGKEDILRTTCNRILEHAEKQKQKSLALPAIGTGMFKFPITKASRIILEAIDDWAERTPNSSLQQILIVDTDSTINTFNSTMNEIDSAKERLSKSLDESTSGDPRKSGSRREERNSSSSSTDNDSDSAAQQFTENKDVLRTPNGLTIALVQDSIAKEKSDVIVNTINGKFDLNAGGTSRSLLNDAPTLQNELNACRSDSRDRIIFVTPGCELRCREVYHLRLIKGRDGSWEEPIRTAVKSVLKKADGDGFSSISFPPIGTGSLRIPHDLVAHCLLDEVIKFSDSRQEGHLCSVRIVMLPNDYSSIKAFRSELCARQKKGYHRVRSERDYEQSKYATRSNSASKQMRRSTSNIEKYDTREWYRSSPSRSEVSRHGDTTKRKCFSYETPVKLRIFAKDSAEIDRAFDELNEYCGVTIKSEVIGLKDEYLAKIISKLTEKQMTRIMSIQEDFCVMTNIEKDMKRIILKGESHVIEQVKPIIIDMLEKIGKGKF